MTKRKTKTKTKPPHPKTPVNPFELPDGHHAGFYCGFDKKNDAIYPAPMHASPMDKIRLLRQEVSEFVDVMNAHIHRQLSDIVRQEDQWWQAVEKEYGVSRGETVYHYFDRCFRKKSSEATTGGAVW